MESTRMCSSSCIQYVSNRMDVLLLLNFLMKFIKCAIRELFVHLYSWFLNEILPLLYAAMFIRPIFHFHLVEFCSCVFYSSVLHSFFSLLSLFAYTVRFFCHSAQYFRYEIYTCCVLFFFLLLLTLPLSLSFMAMTRVICII